MLIDKDEGHSANLNAYLNKLENAVLASFPSNEARIGRRIKQQIPYELPELAVAFS